MTEYFKLGDYETEVNPFRLRRLGLSRYQAKIVYREIGRKRKVPNRILWGEIRKILEGSRVERV